MKDGELEFCQEERKDRIFLLDKKNLNVTQWISGTMNMRGSDLHYQNLLREHFHLLRYSYCVFREEV